MAPKYLGDDVVDKFAGVVPLVGRWENLSKGISTLFSCEAVGTNVFLIVMSFVEPIDRDIMSSSEVA